MRETSRRASMAKFAIGITMAGVSKDRKDVIAMGF
jgi:hypothetical protein